MKKKVLLFILINLQETLWHNLYYPGLWIKSAGDTVALFSQCTGLQVKRSQFETWPVIVLCSWTKHFILTVPLSTQEWKRVLVYCQGNLMKFKWGGGGRAQPGDGLTLSSRQTFTYPQVQDQGESFCYNLGHLTFTLLLSTHSLTKVSFSPVSCKLHYSIT